ncbi:MAG: 50S ribosomal protein L6 [Candidatus Zixiibacteriota bacterium]|nr:MAG: 50S ribosomal protein L6 [candidate division Zixibacteria bacterium]
MSKIGKLPVVIPDGVKVAYQDSQITVTGPKGTLSLNVHPDMVIEIRDSQVVVTRPSDHREHRSLHGLTRSLIQNMVTGVTDGYKITLELVGIGYRAELKGPLLEVNVGYSHPLLMRPPDDISLEVLPKEGKIIVSGIDKQLVGMTAAKIRSFRPPEPYKGKGIKYSDEVIHRKAGKTAGK